MTNARRRAMKRQLEKNGPPSTFDEVEKLKQEDSLHNFLHAAKPKKKKEDKPWEKEEIDRLLNCLFSSTQINEQNFEMHCTRIGKIFNRSFDSIRTLLWKLSTRYREHKDYFPGKLRISRRFQEWRWLDEYILKQAHKKKEVAVQMHLSGVLMRPCHEVREWFERQESKGRSKLGVFKET